MSASPDWIQAWMNAQREAVERWNPTQSAGGTGVLADFLKKLGVPNTGLPGFGGAAGIPDWWRSFNPADNFSGFPGSTSGGFMGLGGSFGPLREHQQLVESLAQALSQHQKLSGDLAVLLAAIHRETLDLLARRVLERANSGHPVNDFKNLYDLWIECGEAIYGKVAGGESYCRLQAELGNAATVVQSLQQQLLERWLKQLDLPTRSELNTLHRRVLDLQRRLDAVAASQSRTASSAPSAPPAKRKAPRKTKG